ncbi:hypothetical protein F5887DRAFT_1060931 [Amanita rubescens]|nr:hypothetical protein F5887DRAFT_1060931 [Amanita rubescens]
MGKAGKSLKSALQAQQSRKGKAKGTDAAKHAKRQTIPFRATDKVLLIGEGDFSFTRALVRLWKDEAADGNGGSSASALMPPTNITATAYDSEEDCYAKYPGAKAIVEEVTNSGVRVLFGVDGTKLEKINALNGKKWDKIVWNFPHAGKGITDQDRNILSNQLLVLAFLRSAAGVLATGPIPIIFKPRKKKKVDDDGDEDEDNDGVQQELEGEDESSSNTIEKTRGSILITLRNVPPYSLWDVPRLAKKPPPPTTASTPHHPRFIQLRSFAFNRSAWPGYEHRMTKGDRAYGIGTTGEGGEDRTWEFCLRDP